MNAKKLFVIAIALMAAGSAIAETAYYKVVMHLKVPRVYDNMQSMGYRKVQSQSIAGVVAVMKDEMQSGEPAIACGQFVNGTHKVNGMNVTYNVGYASDVMWHYIGSNKTGVFKRPQVRFSINMDPSYNVGYDEPDNTLIVTLSGYGSSDKAIYGEVTGQIGCGCRVYGHVSPTRTADKCNVTDIAPVCGRFKMKKLSANVVCLIR